MYKLLTIQFFYWLLPMIWRLAAMIWFKKSFRAITWFKAIFKQTITGSTITHLVISVNDAKYIYFYPIFQIPPALSHCKYKINRVLLFSPRILFKSFASNIIIDLIYNLKNIFSINAFENCLKWVVYINTLQSLCVPRSNNRSLYWAVLIYN